MLAWRSRGRRRAFNSWLRFRREHKLAIGRLRTAIGGFRFGKKRRGWNSWGAYLREREAQLAKLRAAFAYRFVRAMRSWVRAMRVRHRVAALVQMKLYVVCQIGTSACFRLWYLACLSKRRAWRGRSRATKLARRVVERLGRMTLQGALRLWKVHVKRAAAQTAMGLRQQIDELTSRLEASSAVAATVPGLTAERDALHAQLLEEQARGHAQQGMLTNLRAETDELRAELHSAKRQAANAAAGVPELAAERDALLTKLADARSEATAARADADGLRVELERVRQQLLELQAQRAADLLAAKRMSAPSPPLETPSLSATARAALSREASPPRSNGNSNPGSRRSPAALRSPARSPARSPSPRPTAASRGWRMQYSPDWRTDGDAQGWQDSRKALIGRTAAVHHPWATINSPSEYRRRKKALEDGRAMPGDPTTSVAHRSAFAWTQHSFEAPSITMSPGELELRRRAETR